jgi:hypothetical protein
LSLFNQDDFGEGKLYAGLSAESLVVCSLLIFPPHNANAAGDGPKRALQEIKAITYFEMVEPGIFGDGCKIDWDNLKTSLEFVANQSTNLKISQYSRRVDELISKAEVWSLFDAERAAARMAVAEAMLMPTLLIDISPLQTQFACVGAISATLSANVKGSAQIHGSDAVVPNPRVEIWWTSFVFVAPQQTFSKQAIDITEQIMKQLVNDWAASQ